MGRILIALTILALAGCGTINPEPTVEIHQAKVAIPVDCDVDVGPEPDYPDTAATLAAVPYPDAPAQLAANPADMVALTHLLADLHFQVKQLLKGRDMRIQRDHEKSKAICRKPSDRAPPAN